MIPDMKTVLETVERAHARLMPDVPLGGWDVALTDRGLMLLEVNLSCNFFMGSFDLDWYLDFLHRHFAVLDRLKRA